jgi:signal transduction histidine kinase
LIEVRRHFGIGAKIDELSRNPEIAYIVLQDEFGIYAASSNLAEVSSLQNDEELMKAIIKREVVIRNLEFNKKKIIEVSQAFQLGENVLIVTRVGLNQDKIEEIKSDAAQRNILAGLLTFIALIIVLVYILTREKLVNLGIEHQKIQAYVQVLLENIADGVIALDSNKKIIVFNDAAQNALDMVKADVVGRYYYEIFETDIFNITSAIKGETSSADNFIKYTTKKSSTHYLAFTTNATYYFDELESVIVFIRDITNQVKIQKQMELKEKQSAINQLASGIAHEIRNPLNAIFLIVQRFQLEFASISKNEEFQNLLKTVRGEIIRINEIIEEFLEYSRPQKLNLKKSNLSELLDEVVSLSENLAIRKRVELHKNYKEYITLNLDPAKMKQVILNLTQNSFDAMPNGGDLIISAIQEENSTKIRITDSGTGIPDEIKNKIFTLYFTTKKTGHGLGLAIVNQIIMEHNGEITVQSNPGAGTTFEISLPNN